MLCGIKFRGPTYLISKLSELIRLSNPILISPLIRFGVDFLDLGPPVRHQERIERIVLEASAQLRARCSRIIYGIDEEKPGRKGAKGSVECEGEEGGRLTVREREEDRSAARTLRYQREGAGEDVGTSILYALYRPYQMAGSDVT